MRVIVAGGSGFIGSELIRKLLVSKHQVVLLSRKPVGVRSGYNELLQIVQWDGKTVGSWAKFIDGADAIINLSGENVAAKRWSESQKARLIDSRINPTRAILQSINQVTKKPRVLVNASAVGYYGNFGDGDVTESHIKGEGFLSDLCEQWEREALHAEKYGLRIVLLRIGIVLEPSGGALKKMLLPFKLFIGGPLGSGKQWFPWIHREDVINIILFAIENQSLSGPVNVVSPSPVKMKEFTCSLGKVIGKPSRIPVPSLVLKMVLGEMSEMLLGGRRIMPKKLLDRGFVFQYPNLDKALSMLMRKKD
jgi:uncharacterized protein (TIGR01777 family)